MQFSGTSEEKEESGIEGKTGLEEIPQGISLMYKDPGFLGQGSM
jgi:hypothetical protein